jgi:hypothetical protein
MNIDRDTELLLRCARSRSTPANSDRLRALLDGFDGWDSLLASAERQGVLAAVSWMLTTGRESSVPAALRERLFLVTASAAAAHERMWAGLNEILAALAVHGIEAVALKGPAFALQCFASPAARMCRDIDLLVAANRLAATGEALTTLGFAPHLHGERQGRPAHHRKHAVPVLFLRQSDGLYVDLHSELGRPRFGAVPIDTAFRERCHTVEQDGWPVRVLRANDMLLYLCSHGVQHGWRGLRFVADIYEHIAGSSGIEWETLRALAEREHRCRTLRVGVLLAHRFFDAPVPEDCLGWASGDGRAVALSEEASRHLLGCIRARSIAPLGRFAEYRAIEGIARRLNWLRCLAKDAVTPCDLDEAVVRLPRPLFPLYYLIRPLRLAGKYLRGLKWS